MPFTGSHPAAVLPLLGVGLPASALVVGSMAPDFPYYEPVGDSWPTHTALGVVGVDVLLGLVVWVVWHGLLAAPALASAPVFVRARLAGRVLPGLGRRVRSVRDVLLVLVGLAVGSATHVFWDEFSHRDRWSTRHIDSLSRHYGGLAGYRWVQYASGLIGASVIAWWLWSWVRRTAPRPVAAGDPRTRWVWVSIVGVGAVAGFWAAFASGGLREAAFQGATKGGAAMAVTAAALALGWHAARVRGPHAAG